MNLLLEVGTEELPPASVVPALRYMTGEIERRAASARLEHGSVETYGTPRRLAIVVHDVAERTPDLKETKQGPAVRIAFDAEGAPTKAAIGFARGHKVDVADLQRVTTPKGEYIAATTVQPGRAANDVLTEILEAILGGIPWPKPMHWGWNTQAWARPVHWLVALLGDDVLPLRFAGVEAGRISTGHRFVEPAPIEIANPEVYESALEAAHVIPSVTKRRTAILAAIEAAASPYRLVRDEGLLDEVTQLVEYVECAQGTFDEAFLALPREVLISEMREHQRYFAVEDETGSLVNRFVVVYNTPVVDPDVVVRGNQRVLAARLADGAFFLKRDRSRRLESRVDDLSRVVFLKDLGTMRDKTRRIEAIAGKLAELLHPGDESVSKAARRAALLAKADLTTDMVGEFPELQGLMGREYALADDELDEVAVAIAEHYQPRSAKDGVPRSDVGIIASMADKIDTIAGCFSLGLEPTGTADPYGLRRASLGIIRTAMTHTLVFSLGGLIDEALQQVSSDLAAGRWDPEKVPALRRAIVALFERRLRVYLSDELSTDLIDAVLATGLDDISVVVAKVRALANIRDRDGFEPLAVAFKRVKNILKKSAAGATHLAVDEALFELDSERDLWNAYRDVQQRVAEQLDGRDFEAAAGSLIELKEPVDRFFDDVMVMVDDEALRNNRLALLSDLRALFEQMADIARVRVST